MSIDAVLNGAFSSLKTVQQQIALTSNNINNANTHGYTRKSVGLSPTGDGVNQVGVQITNFARATDRILLKQVNAAITDSGAKDVQKRYLDQVQNILGSSSDSVKLTTYLSDFASSWQQLQAEPENNALQSQVIATGSSFANEVRRTAAQIEQLDRNIQSDTSAAVTDLNSALKIIDTANANIAQALSSNLPIGNYEDQRDAAVQTIAQYVDVRVIERNNGQIALYTPQGYGLLDGKASQFSFSGNTITVTGSATSVNNELRGGKLKALLDLRADTSPAAADPDPTQEVVRKLRSQLDTVASSFLTAATSPDSFAQA
jgi:flagellar hook-associated protein 1